MTPLAREWVEKAEGDFEAMTRMARVRNRPAILESVCFHAQQCAEKYLKARLQDLEILFPKSHDLTQLLEFLLPAEPMLEPLRPALASLSPFAVAFRYPGESATREQVRTAMGSCKKVRAALREFLGLESQGKLRKSVQKKLIKGARKS